MKVLISAFEEPHSERARALRFPIRMDYKLFKFHPDKDHISPRYLFPRGATLEFSNW